MAATDHAKRLGREVDEELSLMRAAVDDCRGVKNSLRVTCAPTFAARWLLPRLASYQALPDADAIRLDTAQLISAAGTFDAGTADW